MSDDRPNYSTGSPDVLVYRKRGTVLCGELVGMAYVPDDARMVCAALNGEVVRDCNHFPPYRSTWYDVEDYTGDRIISLRNREDAAMVARILNNAKVEESDCD